MLRDFLIQSVPSQKALCRSALSAKTHSVNVMGSVAILYHAQYKK